MPRAAWLVWFALALSFCEAVAEQDVIWAQEKRIEFLRGYYSTTDSSHFIDLWESQNLRTIAVAGSLGDTHSLFINAHGKAIKSANGKRYMLYPHEELVTTSATPLFHIEDFARLLGKTNAARIHNVVLGACNVEGTLNLAEIRTCFPNATNIVHMPRGQEGYQPMLYQMLLSRSSRVETLYESGAKNESGEMEYEISSRPTRGARKLSPYVAALFRPSESRPYRIQIAGRELLLRESVHSLASAPDTRSNAAP